VILEILVIQVQLVLQEKLGLLDILVILGLLEILGQRVVPAVLVLKYYMELLAL
jgi:hypothetical protein